MGLAELLHFPTDFAHEKVAFVFAHQDDEAFMIHALCRFPGARVVYATDGAPNDPSEWKGFGSREAYAKARSRELHEALDRVGHTGLRIELGFRDSGLMHETQLLRVRVKQYVGDCAIIFTHAYEGGHPDHDAIARAVHELAPRLVIESPYYRMDEGSSVWQRFLPEGLEAQYRIFLPSREANIKRAVMQAHKSQEEAMQKLNPWFEYYRVAPPYDFRRPPNNGQLSRNYERAGVTLSRWDA